MCHYFYITFYCPQLGKLHTFAKVSTTLGVIPWDIPKTTIWSFIKTLTVSYIQQIRSIPLGIDNSKQSSQSHPQQSCIHIYALDIQSTVKLVW